MSGLLKELKPRKALNKAFLKVKPNRSEIENFKTNLIQLLDRINDAESEEFHKNLVIDFLKKTYYEPNHFINTKGRNDLVIHNGNNASSSVGVIIEAKKPTNKSEMMKLFAEDDSPQQMISKLNVKAFQELVLYYLRERITHKNLEVKHLVATNINEWFVFDATLFDRLFAQNKNFVKQFTDFESGRLADNKTDFFYKQIAEPFIAEIKTEIEFTYFNLQEYQKPLRNTDQADDNKLIALFKLLSAEHLLKLPFTNDSNSLDKRFYNELLHIIGLTETKEGGKKLIERNKEGERNSGSILEDAIIQLDSLDKLNRLDRPSQYGNTTQERLFSVGLELSITWINRILFLKLLEAQLITYHKGDKSYSFLSLDKIKNYDDLNSLFFQVLARKFEDRNQDVKKLFENVPYLNSSLFEPTDLEQVTLFISNLKDEKTIPVISSTVLKDSQGKKRTGNLSTLEYLFEFLNAYDFASEGSEEIQEDNKTLINASVLGLIFEKINGYKDGSFFTPGFITMYMCRETIRKAIVQKFNETLQKSPLERGFRGVSSPIINNQNLSKREIIPYNPKLKELARELRNNSTKSEIFLWKELKGKFEGKYDFHRQKPLDNYIADFFCHELKLVIEIDGESHHWEETQKNDYNKEFRLNELGLNVLRFPDSDIFKQLESTLTTIKIYIEGFEKGDFSELKYEDTPLNPLTRNVIENYTHPQPLSRGELDPQSFTNGELDGQPFLSAELHHQTSSRREFRNLDDVYEEIGEDRLFTRQQANDIVNSIKICDPAVGSGHFLVSALNEMIAVKNDLKILQDRSGKRLKEYQVEVVNDELIVTDDEGELFEYKAPSPLERAGGEVQRIQETLFHEKQTIIENCLFGVDINPNSVKICRLRLWIELLKNAYYKNATELETLPNIDINIKCGNSLVSRFAIDADLKQALKKSKWTIDSYKNAVDTYRNAESKEQKREMERLIADIKSDFKSEISLNDPKLLKLRKLSGELFTMTNQVQLFEKSKKEKAVWNKKVTQLTEETKKLENEIEEIKANKIYENAFEWRFEFPEVLNDEGDFVGFDVVIGNPPYIRRTDINESFKDFFEKNYNSSTKQYDLYLLFIELGMNLLKQKGKLTFINPMFFVSESGYGIRKLLLEKYDILNVLNLSSHNIFDEASTYPCIVEISNEYNKLNKIYFYNDNKISILNKIELQSPEFYFRQDFLTNENFIFDFSDDKKIRELAKKINLKSIELGQLYECFRGTPNSKLEFNEDGNYFGIKSKSVKKYSIINDFDKINITSESLLNNEELILMPRTVLELSCAIKSPSDNIVILDRIYCLKRKNNEINNYKIISILNSRLINFWFSFNFSSTKVRGGYFDLRGTQIVKIPIIIGYKNISNELEEKVKKILELKKSKIDTTDLENQINQLVYQLYELTEEEIKIVEGV